MDIVLIAFLLAAGPVPANPQIPVRAGIEAMGGEPRLRALHTLRIEGVGHWNLLEQWERPEPPFDVIYDQLTEERDLDHGNLRQVSQARGAGLPGWSTATVILSDGAVVMERGGQLRPAGGAQLQDMDERLALAPERVLLTALAAPDLTAEPDVVRSGSTYHVARFHRGPAQIRIFLHASTALPEEIEVVEAHPADLFWSVWGEVVEQTHLQQWTLERGGLRYPHQWDVTRNGLAYRSFTLTQLEPNPKLPPESLLIPDALRSAFAARKGITAEKLPLGLPNQAAVELAPGLVQLPGAWNVALVKQGSSVVVLEAPISSGYSAQVIAEAGRRFPGVRVAVAVSTSDAWPHLGGIREYAARGVPLEVLDLNQPIVERVLRAPRSHVPDQWAAHPRRPQLRAVSQRKTVGEGTNRFELIPARTAAGERMMLAYFPALHLLYTSDLVQKLPDGSFFNPESLAEVRQVAEREHLTVDRIFGMHLGPTAWSELTSSVDRALASPDR